jgi:8-oxo-dGTP pyrophosphatase MutT (NUDIX family)
MLLYSCNNGGLMKTIILGNKDDNLKYGFRETCFGIYIKDNKVLVTYDKKHNQYSLIGGGIEENENKHNTLRREFYEEAGIKIKNIKHFITIDCYWLAGGDYPMESLANFYYIDIDKYLDIESESSYEFIDIDKIEFALPYQQKAFELFIKEIKK